MAVLDQFYPFDRPAGAPASAALWGKMAQQFVPDGNIYGYLNQFNASISGGNITVQSGGALVHGYYGEIQNSQTFAVGTNGMVVLGVDMVGESISCYYKDGVTDYNGLTQSATLWEIPLWQISGTTLIDKRSSLVPGRGLTTGVYNIGTFFTVNPSTSTTFNLGVADLTHPCLLHMIFSATYVVTNTANSQNAITSATLQWGLPDQILTPAIEAFYWPGGVAGAGVFHMTTGSHFVTWVNTPGKKTLGLRVTCGSGPSAIQVVNMQVQVLQAGSISNA